MKDIYCDRCKRHVWQQEDNPWVHSASYVCANCAYIIEEERINTWDVFPILMSFKHMKTKVGAYKFINKLKDINMST